MMSEITDKEKWGWQWKRFSFKWDTCRNKNSISSRGKSMSWRRILTLKTKKLTVKRKNASTCPNSWLKKTNCWASTCAGKSKRFSQRTRPKSSCVFLNDWRSQHTSSNRRKKQSSITVMKYPTWPKGANSCKSKSNGKILNSGPRNKSITIALNYWQK